MTKPVARLLVAALAAASLIACQSPSLPTKGPQAPSVPASLKPASAPRHAPQLSAKTAQAEAPMQATLRQEGNTDRLSLRLGRGFKPRPAAQAGFRTQVFDPSEIDSMIVTVTGPGISPPIVSDPVAVTGPGPFVLDLSGIPRGDNRVVTAQFYDADGNAIPVAIAMAVYSSSRGGDLSVSLKRRYVPLGRILEALSADLRASVDAEALQAQIDELLFGAGDPDTDPFVVDPARVDIAAIGADLSGNNGTVGDYSNPAVYALDDGGLDYSITGLVPNDDYTLRIGDPSSSLLIDSATTGTLGTVTPGRWPVRVFLPEGVAYSFDESSIGDLDYRIVDGTADALKAIDILGVDFTPGVDFSFDPVFDYPTPTVDSLSATTGNRGFELTITGTGFHTADKAQNVVDFNDGSANLATVISATATEIVVAVPNVASLGEYNVTVAVGSKVSQESQTFTVKGVWYVKTEADGGTAGAAGDEWDTAVTLQDALDRADEGEELWIKSGVYKPSDDLDREASFEIDTSVVLIGGFAGTESNSADRDPVANPVVLSGDLNDDDSYSTPASKSELATDSSLRDDNSYNVIRNSGGDTLIKDLTIEGGNANHTGPDTLVTGPEGCTPGVDCDYEFTIPNPMRNGGGISNMGGVSLSGVTLRHNSSLDAGGAVFTREGSFDILGSSFFETPDVAARPTLITENLAGHHGGGIYMAASFGDLSHATISRNFSLGSGAGIYLTDLMEGANGLYDLRLLANEAEGDGGGLYSDEERVDAVRSVFADNIAEGFGGGIMYDKGGPGNFEAYSNVIARNQAAFGGGIYVYADASFCCPATTNLDFNASTFFANVATGRDGSGDPESDGSAIYLEGDQKLFLNSNLFFDNRIARASNATITLNYCLFPDATLSGLVHDDGSFTGPATAGSNNQAGIADPAFLDSDLLDGDGNFDVTGLRVDISSAAFGNGDGSNDGDIDLLGMTRAGSPTIGAFEAVD